MARFSTAKATGAAKRAGPSSLGKREQAVRASSVVSSSGESPVKKQRRTAAPKKAIVAAQPDTRPNPVGKPPFWADSKPELSQTIIWYNSYQAAVYTCERIARGILLDMDEGEGGYIDNEMIIANLGGGRGDVGNGTKGQIKDQVVDQGVVAAIRKNMEDKQPLGVIVGDRNPLMPVRLPHRYCGLDMFHVTHLWYEKSNGYLITKIKLEKLELFSRSWWAPEGGLPPTFDRCLVRRALRKSCDTCGLVSVQVFNEGWICLQHSCPLFWTLDGASVEQKDLSYNPDFLTDRTPFLSVEASYNMVPSLPDPNAPHGATFSFSDQCQRGIVCPRCLRCNARQEWDKWRCYNDTGCQFEHQLPHDIVSAATVRGLSPNIFDGPAISGDSCHNTVRKVVEQTGYWRTHTYELPQPGLFVVHQHSCETLNKMPMGPNQIFVEIQASEIGLRRNAMKCSRVPGSFTDHFTTSFGMKYKYIAPTDVASFTDAPDCILQSVRRVEWAAQQAIPIPQYKSFNELMVVGYFKGGHMGYHDDGEPGLGPTVGSLSLGKDSDMIWRMKRKYYTGFSATDCKVYNPNLAVLAGCNNYEERLRLNELAKTVTKEELNKEARRVLCPRGYRKEGPVILSLKLRHGDIMVMHGGLMQEYYEHQASSVDGLRFALTCRWIDPSSIDPNELWKADFPKGIMDPENAYDGDLPAYEVAKQERNRGARLLW